MNFKIFHMGGLIKVTLFTSTTCKKLFKHFSFYLLTFLSWTSLEAGWASYSPGSLADLANAMASGDVIYYNGQYLATPDYSSMFKHETIVYYHDISPDVENTASRRYALAELDIDFSDYYDNTTADLDGIN